MPEEKKGRWGAFVKPSIEGQFRDRADAHTGTKYSYRVMMGPYRKENMEEGETFVSSPKISSGIAEIGKLIGYTGKVNVGHVSFGVKKSKKEIGVMGYFPFYYFMPDIMAGGLSIEMKSKAFKMIKGMGLANRIELRALKHLQKKFPGYGYVAGSSEDQKARIKQLLNRGSELGKAVPIQEEIQRIANRIGGFARKGRWKRRLFRRVKKVVEFTKRKRPRK
ncbi:MAG: hypothetical protein Q8N60_02995 [Candidatus Diapherotrites archaeon]|nr:hypothetical protein [Candidatus Diapherotrites archaeon]